MSTKNHLVFVPLPIMSHLNPAVQTAKLLIVHDQTLSIAVLVLKTTGDTKIADSIENSLHSRITFVEIYENHEHVLELRKSPNTFLQRFSEGLKDPVKDKVAQLMKNVRVLGPVVDIFCTCMIDVANELGIPSFLYPISGAASLSLLYHLQNLRDNGKGDFDTLMDDVDAELHVKTYVHQVPVKVVPPSLLESDCAFLTLPRRFIETKGILINTFLELEPHAVRALTDDEDIPPVYAIDTGNQY